MDVTEAAEIASVGCGFYRSKSVGCGVGCGFVGARSKYNL